MKKLLIILTVAAFMLTGCATTQKRPFTEITDFPAGRGVVYIYMPRKSNVMQGAEIRVDNSDGIGTYVGNIKKGTYIPYIAPAGENLFKIGNKAISINVVEKDSSFIQLKSYKLFWSMVLKLIPIDPSAGFLHIKSTQQR